MALFCFKLDHVRLVCTFKIWLSDSKWLHYMDAEDHCWLLCPPQWSFDHVLCFPVLTWFPFCSISPFHVLMLCRKYKSTLKFCYEIKKKDGFCKNKKKIFLAEQDLQGHCPHNVPVNCLHSPCPTYPYGGVQFRCQPPCDTEWSWMITEEALTADPIRLLRETTGISQQIFWYNTQPRYIYICTNIWSSQLHFILFTVQNLAVFHKDFNN